MFSIEWLVIWLRCRPSTKSRGDFFWWCKVFGVERQSRLRWWTAPSWKLQRWKSPSCVTHCVIAKPSHSMPLNKLILQVDLLSIVYCYSVLSCFMGRMSSWNIRSRRERVDVYAGVASWREIYKQRNRDPALLRSAGGYQSQKNRFMSP